MTTHPNFFVALQNAFPANKQATAVWAEEGLTYSWQDLEDQTARLANLIDSLQLPPSSRIAVQVDKSVEMLMLYLATLRAGHVFLPLNTAYQSSEVDYFLGNATPAVVVCSPANLAWVTPIAAQNKVAHVFTLDDKRQGSLLESAASMASQHTPARVAPDALAVIIYTSGTTGRSKGAMLSHSNIASNAQTLKTYWNWQADDVLIHALPIFHVHGLFVAIHGALINGSPMIWMNKFDPKRSIEHMSQGTVFMGVPTLYTRMLAEPCLNKAATAHMRLFVSGSAPMLAETHAAWQAATGHAILERYGMSETVMLTSNPCLPDARFNGQSERRGGTVGFPLPGVTLRVVDEANQPLPADEIGGIQVKGPNVFLGYWQMPEKTAEEFTADGFFKTGDVGQQAADGYVTIVGRSKDLIISGGYNVYPAEIESFINNLDGVAESAVVGVPHPDFGEVGVAVVVAKPGASVSPESVVQAIKSQMANFKVPKHCVLIDTLPRNIMGKVQKNVLRDAHIHRFQK
jgi:malonyl-CoA/methylmalonyl-CoA synthetase